MLLDLTTIPTLTTPRLMLRGFRDTDLDQFAAMLADPEIMRFKNSGQPASRAESWRGLVNVLGHWVLRGYGLFAVESLATGEFLGSVGLIQPEGWPGAELTWTIARPAWGQGYATEAAAAVRDWAFASQDFAQLISLIDTENVASIRVAEKIGMGFDRWGNWRGEPIHIYAIACPAAVRSAEVRAQSPEVVRGPIA